MATMPFVVDEGILAAIAQRLGQALAPRQRPAHALVVDGARVAFFDGARRDRLAAFDRVLERHGESDLAFVPSLHAAAARTEAFDVIARTLASEGALTAWRNERYPVVAHSGSPCLFLVERAAARYLGIHTFAAHANGLVRTPGGEVRMWLARRSATKAIDPSCLDNLVGGGIPAGESPDTTLVREAWEEAGVAASVAARARACGQLYVERHVRDGLQRETVYTYDLALDPSWRPSNQDGEAVEHRSVSLREAARLVAQVDGADPVTVDASLVIVECLMRHELIPASSPTSDMLARLCRTAPG